MMQVPEKAHAGSKLEGLEVQVIDENGNVDSKMDGSLHTLTLDWNLNLSVALVSGACTLPAINLPILPGTWRGRVAHSLHPELFFVLEASRSHLLLKVQHVKLMC